MVRPFVFWSSLKMASRFKKGDVVMVDVDGQAVQYEIMDLLSHGKEMESLELLYDARDISSGERKTVSEDEILRLATPIDNSAGLFERKPNSKR
jgi:hypothetical protein